MKILFVDTSVEGHHKPYLLSLVNSLSSHTCVFFLKGIIPEFDDYKTYSYTYDLKSLTGYLKWIRDIRKIAKKEHTDCVHLLYGDILYRFFGIGLSSIPGIKIVTFHHMRYGTAHELSVKRIFKKINRGIVHTIPIENQLNIMGISNVTHIEYPVFEKCSLMSEDQIISLKRRYNVDKSGKILLALGGTRIDKGLDVLLESLSRVDSPFRLIIAGKEQDIKRERIEELAKAYRSKVNLILRYLSEDEIDELMNLSDVVVLPYRKIFDGASGPLGLAVLHKKVIIGPNHGSLGEQITDNHLGFTFLAEDQIDLTRAINQCLLSEFRIDSFYLAFREGLLPEHFSKSYCSLYSEMES